MKVMGKGDSFPREERGFLCEKSKLKEVRTKIQIRKKPRF
jgi:hypothetical protein